VAGGGGSAADGRVHRAVAAGLSEVEVRRAIIDCAQGSAERRVAAVNQARRLEVEDALNQKRLIDETPLRAAHRLGRGDLVGVLLEAGADVSVPFWGGRATALVLCVAYGQVEALRALLLQGRNAKRRVEYLPHDPLSGIPRNPSVSSTLAHLCVAPPRVSPDAPTPPPQLACLEVLVREGGADVNARTLGGMTPLHWVTRFAQRVNDHHLAALDLLVRLGADVDARDDLGKSPIFGCLEKGNLAGMRRLLDHGASPDAVDEYGHTPVMCAFSINFSEPDRSAAALELSRRSSPETRRAVSRVGWSAVDYVIENMRYHAYEACHFKLIGELLTAGAPVLPENAARVLPIAAAFSARQEAELAARRSESRRWRAHEAFVGLAFDMGELKDAERAFEARRARLAALELELLELGAGSGSRSGSGSESESDGAAAADRGGSGE
jgi:hypothetical protein